MHVTIYNYTRRSTDARLVIIGDISLWFSYQTCIGFQKSGSLPVFVKNEWGPTTGRHLTEAGSDRQYRLPLNEFEAKLGKMLNEAGCFESNDI